MGFDALSTFIRCISIPFVHITILLSVYDRTVCKACKIPQALGSGTSKPDDGLVDLAGWFSRTSDGTVLSKEQADWPIKQDEMEVRIGPWKVVKDCPSEKNDWINEASVQL